MGQTGENGVRPSVHEMARGCCQSLVDPERRSSPMWRNLDAVDVSYLRQLEIVVRWLEDFSKRGMHRVSFPRLGVPQVLRRNAASQ